ncbi:MAG: Rrf2 family transcriptional regulator [Candidatus Omnitrophota bacterium]
MKITYKGDYALKTILDLARHYGNSPVTIHDLAKRADIPIKFLEQILLDLKRGGFVESRRGKVGGYLLAKEPSGIKLGEVIRFIEGPIEPIACVAKNYQGCGSIYNCVLREVWQWVNKATCGIIDNITFEDLLKKIEDLDCTISYQI